MAIIDTILTLSTSVLINYIWIFAFFAPHLNGEVALLVLSFFAAQGLYPLWIVIMMAIIGNLIMDAGILIVMKSKSFSWLKDRTFHKSKKYFALEKHIEEIAHGKDWLIVFMSKFMFGARNLVFIYMGNRGFSIRRYWKNAIFSVPLWVIIITSIGFFIGKQFTNINDVYGDMKITLSFLAGFFLLLFIGTFVFKEIVMHYKGKKGRDNKSNKKKSKSKK